MKVRGNTGGAWTLAEPPVAAGPHALVYRATGEDGFPVAVKVARRPGRDGGWIEDEADELRAWGGHPAVGPYVVPLWDAGLWEGRAFHVTSWFDTALHDRCGKGTASQRRELARALVRAVLEVRRCGLVHPNLHPHNVFVQDHEGGPVVFLADPCERPALRPAWSTSGVLPSTAHASPEHVVAGHGADDVYALAACVFAVLVGHAPEASLANALALTEAGRRSFAGAGPAGELGAMIDLDRCVPLTPEDRAALRAVAPPRVVDALALLLAPDPERRSRDPAPLLDALAEEEPAVPRPRRWAPVAAAVGLGALGVAALVARSPQAERRPVPDYPMVELPPGEFLMGSPAEDPEHGGDEEQHRVTLTRGFRLGAVEVTQARYEAVLGENPTATGTRRWGGAVHGACSPYDGRDLVGPELPVVCVSWLDVVRLANAWSVGLGLEPVYTIDGDRVTWDRAADGLRLPTEAEWEYAARAGTTGAWGPAPDGPGVCGWANFRAGACDDGAPGLMPVGGLAANAWGLRDLLGNAQEWTWDAYAPFTAAAAVDPVGPEVGELRVNRGGAWFRPPRTVAWRSADSPDVRAPSVGVRLARDAP